MGVGLGFEEGETEMNKSKVYWGTYQLVDVRRGRNKAAPRAPATACAVILSSAPLMPHTPRMLSPHVPKKEPKGAAAEKGADGEETVRPPRPAALRLAF